MCTTIKYKNCMGRNFDYEVSYDEEIKIYDKEQYKICGVVTGIIKDYPLYYDAMNEFGLCIAGLNFEDNAKYNDIDDEKFNVASWEIPIKILGNCKNVEEVKKYIKELNITNVKYDDNLPISELHWFICDENNAIVIEQTENGLNVYEDNFNVLTNNPPFKQMEETINANKKIFKTSNFAFTKILPKNYKTRGLETYGLLGDLTSISRFERINFYKDKLNNTNDKFNSVIETFHLLNSVEQIYGATPFNNKFEYTIYKIVYDMENKKVYYRRYEDLNTKVIDFNKMLNIKEFKF